MYDIDLMTEGYSESGESPSYGMSDDLDAGGVTGTLVGGLLGLGLAEIVHHTLEPRGPTGPPGDGIIPQLLREIPAVQDRYAPPPMDAADIALYVGCASVGAVAGYFISNED